MARHPMPDMDLIHEYRLAGMTYPEIARRLADLHGRTYQPGSISNRHRAWLAAQGASLPAHPGDLRWGRRRTA